MRTELAVARSDYLAVRVAEYRMDIFGLLRQTRSLTSAGLARRLSLIVDEAIAHGGDGLEPLLLAYADAIATRGDANAKKSAIADLSRGAAEIRFRAKQIPSGIPVPLGLDRSYVVLDVRADAMRAFVHDLFDDPTAFGLGDVFGRVKTKKDECGLPAQPGNPGAPISPAPASPSETPTLAALAADQQRQDDCAKFGGSQKGIAGQLGDVASAACLNLDNFTLRSEIRGSRKKRIAGRPTRNKPRNASAAPPTTAKLHMTGSTRQSRKPTRRSLQWKRTRPASLATRQGSSARHAAA